ncbi:HAD family hydrolase [Propioniferax innocua]|uniref:HAD family hydrolase n=1 Tax=Propioniferax innocua TaxID=1753 RepID=UPI003CCC4A49
MFDFDGTVALGLGPVRAYGRKVSEAMADGQAFQEALFAELSQAQQKGAVPAPALDAYDLVRLRATAQGVPSHVIDQAYLDSRTLLATDAAPVVVPDGLADFLSEVESHPGIRVALVTNAPPVGLDRALELMGLSGRFDLQRTSAGKPRALGRMARGWLEQGRVLSIGDIWRNDLRPVHDVGGDTALIGRPPLGARPTFHAPTLPSLYPDVCQWVANTTSTHSTHM